MAEYRVSGDAFRSDSVSVKRDPPPFFDSAEDDSEFAQEFGVNVNYTQSLAFVSGGYARLYDGSDPWHAFFDETVQIDLETDTETTYLYAVYDSALGRHSYVTSVTETAPTNGLSILVAEIDAGTEEVRPRNENPEVAVGSTSYRGQNGNRQRSIQYDDEMEKLVVVKHE